MPVRSAYEGILEFWKEIVYSPNKYRETEGIKRISTLILLHQRERKYLKQFVRKEESLIVYRFVLLVQKELVQLSPRHVLKRELW